MTSGPTTCSAWHAEGRGSLLPAGAGARVLVLDQETARETGGHAEKGGGCHRVLHLGGKVGVVLVHKGPAVREGNFLVCF